MSNRRLPIGGSESVALISILAIAVVLVFAYLDRQAQGYDRMALDLARAVQPVAKQILAAPDASLSEAALKAKALPWPPEVKALIPPGQNKGAGWRITIWHPQGTKRYVVTDAKIETEFI